MTDQTELLSTDDEDLLDDSYISPQGKILSVCAVCQDEDFLFVLQNIMGLNPLIQIDIYPPDMSLTIEDEVIQKSLIFIVECRFLQLFDDINIIRDWRQKRPLAPILALTHNGDAAIQSHIYAAGAIEVLNPKVLDAQVFQLKIQAYEGFSTTAATLEIKNQETIETMRSLRHANSLLQQEMESRVAAERQKAVAEKKAEENKNIREIMDHLEEGYFSINPSLEISPQISKACFKIFENDIAGYKLNSSQGLLPFLDPHFEDHLTSCLEQIFDDIIPYSVTLSMLPKKIWLKKQKIISIKFDIILDKNKNPEKIICIAKDITQEEKDAKKTENIQKMNQILLGILRRKESFLSFLSDFREKIKNMRTSGSHIDLKKMARDLHTLKGNSLAYGLSEVAHRIHEAETKLNATIVSVPRETLGIESVLIAFLEEHKETLKISYQDFVPICMVEEAKLDALYQLVTECPQSIQQMMMDILDDIKVKNFFSYPTFFESLIASLSQTLKKNIHFKMTGFQEKMLLIYGIEPVMKTMVHLLRNACDHGLEFEKDRLANGKQAHGTLLIKFSIEKDQSLLIKIIDDGQGINTDAILKKAIKNGVADPNREYHPEDIYQMIFSDNISTAQELTEISGRGIGMGAVKDSVEELGGRIHISSERGFGTTFQIRIPSLRI